jgi:DNA-binding LacI/PurR family transcriptional regulator
MLTADQFLLMLRDDLRSARCPEGNPLPTLREFEAQYGLGKDAVNRVFGILEGEGLIVRSGRRRYPAVLRNRSEDRVFAVEHVFRRGEHPFYGTLSDGINDEFLSSEYGVHLFTHREPGKSEISGGAVMSTLLERGILRGVLLLQYVPPDEETLGLIRRGVSVCRMGVEPGPGVILIDVEHAALQGTHHMAKLGFGQIGIVHAYPLTGLMDIQGYHRALDLHELSFREEDIIDCTEVVKEANATYVERKIPYEDFIRERLKPIVEGARQIVLRRIRTGNFPRGLYISDEFLAIGTVRALQEGGLRVPEDVAVVSHMSSGNWAVELSGLTTTQFNGYQCGIEAARYMVDVAEGRRSIDDRLILQARLVKGMSCGELDDVDIEGPDRCDAVIGTESLPPTLARGPGSAS